MNIAILGTGNVGTTLATKLVELGHDVTFGSRTPQDTSALPAPALSHAQAVASADLVINATPGGLALELLNSIGADALDGKVLLDVSNAVGPDMNLIYPNDSVARLIQEAFPAVKVVKSLNTFNTSVMTNPGALSAQTTVYVSGNDADAKATVTKLLADLGWPASAVLDLGGIETARAVEHYFYLFFATMLATQTPTFNIAVTR
jgi:predicted dinucleotide-binding enzyme